MTKVASFEITKSDSVGVKKAILGLKLRISTDFEEASEKTTFEPKIEKDQGTGIKFRTLKLFS